MTNRDNRNGVPGRWALAINGLSLAVFSGVLAYLIATYPAEPDWFDRLGVLVYVGLVVMQVRPVVSMVRRREVARREPIGYVDSTGRYWDSLGETYGEAYVQQASTGTYPLEYVTREWGPLEPVYRARVSNTGDATATGPGSIANTGIMRRDDR